MKMTNSEEEQPFPLAVRGNEGGQEAERRRRPENRLVIHNRAIGDINTIAGGFAGGGESSSRPEKPCQEPRFRGGILNNKAGKVAEEGDSVDCIYRRRPLGDCVPP
jgi:hypothetical protein